MTDSVDAFLAELPDAMRPIATALRERLRQLLPDATETRHGGWKIVGYSLDGTMKTMICGILPHRKWVNVQFPSGTDLQDPESLLEGTGKKARHVKVRSVEDAADPGLAALVREARDRVVSGA